MKWLILLFPLSVMASPISQPDWDILQRNATNFTINAGHYSITNPANGKWFITNIDPPMEQEAMDWCTG